MVIALTAVCACAGMSSLMALAQQQDSSDKSPDIRLLIDISGSMRLNDPANLRRPAVDLLVKLLPQNAKAGVWTFGSQVNMLIPHKPVSEGWRQSAIRQANKINSVGLYTNIGAALEKAAYDAGRTQSDYNTSLILLTDGMVDISKDPLKNQQEWRRIVEEVLPKLKQAGFTIHTIALSDNADQALMSQLSMATDGLDAVAKNADELMEIFLQAFNKSAPAEQLPFDGESFLVDSSVEEFTALIFYQPGSEPSQLIAPDNSRYGEKSSDDSVRWFAGDGFDLVTVKRPFEGEWRVQADVAPNSRITVVSDLSLKVAPMANNLKPGESLDLSLLFKEDGKKIISADFLALLDVKAELSGAASWSETLSTAEVPANGIYTTKVDEFRANGEYRLVVNVDGKTFKRRYEHTINVRAPFVAKITELEQAAVPSFELRVAAPGQDIDFASSQLSVAITRPDGKQEKLLLQLQQNRSWTLEYQPDVAGNYTFVVKAMGQLMNGAAVSETLPLLNLNFESELAPAVAKKIDPPVQPEPASDVEPAAPEVDEYKDLIKYGAIAGINLLLLLVGFFVIRKVMGKKKPDESGAEEEEVFVNVNEAEANVEDPVADDIAAGPDEDVTAEIEASAAAEPSSDEAEVLLEAESIDPPAADIKPENDEPEEAIAAAEPEPKEDVEQEPAADDMAMDEMSGDDPEAEAVAVADAAEVEVVELTEEVKLDEPAVEAEAEPEPSVEPEAEPAVDDMGMADLDDEIADEDNKKETEDELDDIDALLDAVADANSGEEDFDIDDLLASEGGLDISSDEVIEKDLDEVKKPA